jgi:hypothetical protein
MTDTEMDDKDNLEGLYDLAIPIGMPVTVIHELVENFELEPVRRKAKVGLIDDDTEEREILVLRGEQETVQAAQKYMFEALDRRVKRWEKSDDDERSLRYKEMYEKQKQERLRRLRQKKEESTQENSS